jgi:hypothetical protein
MEPSAADPSSARQRTPLINAEASSSRIPLPFSTSPSRAAIRPPLASALPETSIDVFAEPFVLEEEPEDEDQVAPIPEEPEEEQEEVEKGEAGEASSVSMYVALFEGQSL